MSVGEVYDINFGPALASLDKLADQDEKFRASVVQTARAQQAATQQVVQSAVAAGNALEQQLRQQQQAGAAYKALTAELRAQQQVERSLNTERDKANGSARRQQEITTALAENRAAQQRLREEIQRTTAAQQAQARAAQTAASIPPPTVQTTVTGVDNSLSRAQQQAILDVQATTAALNQQAGAAQAASTAAAPIAGAYTQAAVAAAELQQQLRAAQAEQQAARDVVTEQIAVLRQLKAEQQALNAEKAAGGSTADQQRVNAALKRNAEEQRRVTSAIAESRIAYQQEGAAVAQVRQAIRQQASDQKLVAAAARDAATAQKQVAAAAKEGAAAQRQFAAAAKDGAVAQTGAATAVTGLKGAFAAAGGLAAGFFAVDKAIEFTKNIVSTRAEFERLENVLTNNFGGDRGKAQQSLTIVATFARDTGQSVTELTNSYLSLVNRGIEPTRRQLEQLSDIAKSSNKSIDQFTEALLDAQTGEFERLKSFGLKAKASGDAVQFTFKGVTTEVKNSADAIAQYLFGLGDVAGVMGATQAAADGFEGSAGRLKASLTELFDVLGDGTNGPLAGFIQRVNRATRSVTDFFKSTDRKAIEAASQGIQDYGNVVDDVFRRAAEGATKGGQDRNTALRLAFDQQEKLLIEQQRKAAERVKAIQDYQNNVNQPTPDQNPIFSEFFVGGPGGRSVSEGFQLMKEALTTAKTRLKLAEGERRVLKERYEITLKGGKSEIEQIGVIEQLRKKIKQEQGELEQLQRGPEFEAQRQALVATIKKDEQELGRLLGKEQQKRVDKLTSALNSLREAERNLLAESSKVRLDQLKADGIALADEQLRQDLLAVKQLEDTIRKKEALVKKAGGTGADADGQISGPQQEQLNLLTAEAQRRRDETVLALERQTNARILELQVESDEKELTQLRAKFDEEIRIAREGNNQRLVVELEAAKKRQVAALAESQDLRRIEEATAREVEAINRQKTLTPQVDAPDVTADGSNNPALAGARRENIFRRLLANAAVDIEKEKQKRILEAQIRGYNEQLKRLENNFTEEGIQRKTALQNSVEDATASLNKLSTTPKFNLLNLLGVAPEDRQEVEQAFTSFASSSLQQIQAFAQAQVAAAQNVIDAKNQQINETQSAILAEIALNREGSASNIATLKEQLAQERAQRREAVEEKRKAAKIQLLVDTATQGSALVTASAQVLEGFSKIPVLGFGLGLAAISVMLTGFVAAKSKALSSINKADQGFFLGGYTGDGDKHEESKRLGDRGYTYHRKEFVMNNELTSQYRHALLEPLHAGRPQDIDWQHPNMVKLLPDLELPKQIKAEKQAAAQVQVVQQFAPMQAEFKAMQQKLEAIERHVGTTAARPDMLAMPDGSTMQVDPVTGSSIRRYTEGAK